MLQPQRRRHTASWEMKLCALAALAAATTSSAVASSFPNRMFSRMLVANSAGSWLTSPICARSHFSRSLRMSTPSTITSPADGSSAITVDLPDPLPPTSATVRPAGTRRLKLTKMGLSGRDG
uniref:Secreted protein n=1 Tax=Oryza glumipatula TaxID=40148 RepID=A0A0D9YNI8_9ORYZ